jgi:hypothetical protein
MYKYYVWFLLSQFGALELSLMMQMVDILIFLRKLIHILGHLLNLANLLYCLQAMDLY